MIISMATACLGFLYSSHRQVLLQKEREWQLTMAMLTCVRTLKRHEAVLTMHSISSQVQPSAFLGRVAELTAKLALWTTVSLVWCLRRGVVSYLKWVVVALCKGLATGLIVALEALSADVNMVVVVESLRVSKKKEWEKIDSERWWATSQRCPLSEIWKDQN